MSFEDFDLSSTYQSLDFVGEWDFQESEVADIEVRPRVVAPPDYSQEAVLLPALQSGDEDAFEYLVRSQSDRMHAIARRFFPEDEDARDAVQEAFLAAHRSIHGFEGHARISTWLHRVVVNACLMKLRSRRRKPEQSLDEATTATLVSVSALDAQQNIEGREIATRVQNAIAELPEPHRSVLRLREIEERDTRETAKVLSISPAAVKTRLHRARMALRSRLIAEESFWEMRDQAQSA